MILVYLKYSRCQHFFDAINEFLIAGILFTDKNRSFLQCIKYKKR